MYDELIKRLRERCVFLFPHHGESRSYDADLMHEAADAIEKLQQMAAHYEETAKDYFKDVCYYLERVPKWIPVTERLPEEREDVLVALRRGEIAVDYYQPNRWGYSDVTHWMPLPEPPEGE